MIYANAKQKLSDWNSLYHIFKNKIIHGEGKKK